MKKISVILLMASLSFFALADDGFSPVATSQQDESGDPNLPSAPVYTDIEGDGVGLLPQLSPRGRCCCICQ